MHFVQRKASITPQRSLAKQAGQKRKMVQADCSKETGNIIEHNVEWGVLWRFSDEEQKRRFFIGNFDPKMFHWPSHWLNKWETCDQTQLVFTPEMNAPWPAKAGGEVTVSQFQIPEKVAKSLSLSRPWRHNL
jgi:hypothetical protein